MADTGREVYTVPWWLVDNPQARAAALPDPTPIVEPFELWLVPDSTPEPDPTVQYPGQGAKALWDDVWKYSKSVLSYFGRSGGGLAYVTTDMLNNAVDDTLKAAHWSLSGFINQSTQLAIDAQNWTSHQLDALDANIGAIYQYFDDRINGLRAFQQAVEALALPSLQAQILQLRHDMNLGFQFNSAVDRAWSIDNIFRPLTDTIGQVARDIPIWSEGAYERAKLYTDDAVQGLGLRTLTQLVPLAVAVKALETFKDECAQPMCDTMGPKTDLGKLLKGLKVAGEIAALTAILQMNEHDLANLIHAVTSHLAAVVGDIEQFTGTGGETVAGLIAAATRDLV